MLKTNQEKALEKLWSDLEEPQLTLKGREELSDILIAGVEKINPPKRGKSLESFSDAANLLKRACRDRLMPQNSSMQSGYRFAAWLFNNNCYICGRPAYDSDGDPVCPPIQADHVIPPSLGGAGAAGNMAPAHNTCNNAKGESDPEEYFADKPEVLSRLKLLRHVFSFSPSDPEVINDDIDRLVLDLFEFISRWINQKRSETGIDEHFVLPPSLKLPDLEITEVDLSKTRSRWQQDSRSDQPILNALCDVGEDRLGLYASYSEFSSNECSLSSRIDVKDRISRFVEIVEHITGKTDLRSLTTDDFYAVIRCLELLFSKKPYELSKYRRFARVLVEHPDLKHLRTVAWESVKS